MKSNEQVDPYLDEGIRGWIINECRKQFWKVASWYEFEDLVQDAYLVYTKCLRRFRTKTDDRELPLEELRAVMMGYFQRAFFNHMTDLQQHPRSRCKEVAFGDFTQEQENELTSSLESDFDLSDADMVSLLARAPAEIVDMLKKLLVDGVADLIRPATIRLPLAPGRRKTWVVRETTSEHIDRCLGQPGAAARLRKFLTSS